MACNTIELPGGGMAIVCGPRARRRRCVAPGCDWWADAQCDYPLVSRPGKTCDRYLCQRHRVEQVKIPGVHAVTGRVDYCEPHDRFARFLNWIGHAA